MKSSVPILPLCSMTTKSFLSSFLPRLLRTLQQSRAELPWAPFAFRSRCLSFRIRVEGRNPPRSSSSPPPPPLSAPELDSRSMSPVDRPQTLPKHTVVRLSDLPPFGPPYPSPMLLPRILPWSRLRARRFPPLWTAAGASLGSGCGRRASWGSRASMSTPLVIFLIVWCFIPLCR